MRQKLANTTVLMVHIQLWNDIKDLGGIGMLSLQSAADVQMGSPLSKFMSSSISMRGLNLFRKSAWFLIHLYQALVSARRSMDGL
jgi:hypothetical protein